MNRAYQVCTRCVMDTSAADIRFDGDGVCNYCATYLERYNHVLTKDPLTRKRELENFVERVRASRKGRSYDCIVGVSGGLDSSWALMQAVRLGLRPLAVHMDNGWNSELAQNNIANLVRGLGVDLYTHVIDWNEYRNLMQAFFDADVVDIELLYDNAMRAVNWRQAAKYGVKYILSGVNQATEGMGMPKGWNWNKTDVRNIKSIGKRFSGVTIKTFPAIDTLGYLWHMARGRRWVPFLDFFDYNKATAAQALIEEFGYKPYPYKHYESVFTRFYQGYLLPEKFGIDKRRLHFATLVMSGQMSREEALDSLRDIPYPSVEELNEDKKYFLKKMGWSEAQLEAYLRRPPIPHDAYPTEKRRLYLIYAYRRLGQLLRG